MNMNIKRGEIYYADLSPVVGSEQGGIRPVLILQNDTGNKHSPTTIVAAITSRKTKANLSLHGSMKNRSNICPESSVGTKQDSKGSSKMNATSAKNPIRRYSSKKPIRQCNRSRKNETPKGIPTAKPTSSKSPSLLNAQTAVSG